MCFTGVLFRVMDSALHLSGWMAIFHFCSHILGLSKPFSLILKEAIGFVEAGRCGPNTCPAPNNIVVSAPT